METNAERKTSKVNKSFIAFLVSSGVLFAIMLVISALIPMSGDDWYWGTKDFTFATITNLNGRYLGTILALLMTKFAPIKVIATAAVVTGIIYVISRVGGKNRFIYFMFAALLILAMPIKMFAQAIAWSSGFANYAPSALIMAIYVYLSFNMFSDEPWDYPKYTFLFSGALGVCGALFMENITLGNIIISAAMIIYSLIRFKKVDKVHIAFLAGAVLGAVLMLLDGAYLNIFGPEGGTEDGRKLSLSLIFDNYFNDVHWHLVYNNVIINLFIFSALCVNAYVNFSGYSKRDKSITVTTLVIMMIFIIISLFESMNIYLLPNFRYVGALKGLLSALYLISLFVYFIFAVNDSNLKLKLLFLSGCIAAYTLPLFVVEPIGARNFFETYVLFAIMAVLLFSNALKGLKMEKDCLGTRIICLVLSVLVVVQLCQFICGYLEIYIADTARIEEMLKLLKEGKDSITLEKLPKKDMVWNGDPIQENNYLQMIFKEYYNIPEEVSIIVK